VHARLGLGPRVASSSAEVGPVDVASLPNASVEELTVHVPSPPCVPLVSMGGRLVDAITLLSASVAELEAPVSPPPPPGVFPGGASPVSAVMSPSQLDSPVPEGDIHVVSADKRFLASSSGTGLNVSASIEAGQLESQEENQSNCNMAERASALNLSLGTTNSWVCKIRAKPPCFKVYARRRVQVQPAQTENSGLSTPLLEFLEGATKPTDGLLPPSSTSFCKTKEEKDGK
jgi:hypothetical protein